MPAPAFSGCLRRLTPAGEPILTSPSPSISGLLLSLSPSLPLPLLPFPEEPQLLLFPLRLDPPLALLLLLPLGFLSPENPEAALEFGALPSERLLVLELLELLVLLLELLVLELLLLELEDGGMAPPSAVSAGSFPAEDIPETSQEDEVIELLQPSVELQSPHEEESGAVPPV